MKKDKDRDKIILQKHIQKKMAESIQAYIEENLDIQIGNLQSEMFLDFITKELAHNYYNKAIEDSMALLTEKIDDLYLLMKNMR